MKLLFDIGNTTIGIALLNEEDKVVQSHRLNTNLTKTADEYYLDIKQLVSLDKINSIAIASVVPVVTKVIKTLATKFFNIEPFIVQASAKTGLQVITDNPKEVGADIICTAAAVIDPKESTLILDLGTATKYIYIRKNALIGVILTPGVKISIEALVGNTALLPNIDIKVPNKVLGTNTVECMQSGATYGVAAQVDGLIDKIKAEVKEDFKIVVTGGLSKVIIPLLQHETIVEPNLIYYGLNEIQKRNI
ncbi:MAG TPA: type III pantothenate kinase [Haploplasma sp.]|nr:type III pantothenate kinase [Haploplasma sp.]